MNLQKIIDECQDGFSSITDYSLIATFKKFEQYVTESYSGRLFFELIQNARDAAFEHGVQSQILIKITDDKAYFANTGKPFTEAGIRAMARLGVSPKDNTALIGHKGIGFKAIQEYTKSPKIVGLLEVFILAGYFLKSYSKRNFQAASIKKKMFHYLVIHFIALTSFRTIVGSLISSCFGCFFCLNDMLSIS